MKPAIFFAYCLEQNEPSRPNSQVVWIPNDKEAREALLTELYNDAFSSGRPTELSFGFEDTNDNSCYCDLYVSDGSNYVFLTYLTGKRPGSGDAEGLECEKSIKTATEYRLLFPKTDRQPEHLGDKVYTSEHGAKTGRAMRAHNATTRSQIKILKVEVEVIEVID